MKKAAKLTELEVSPALLTKLELSAKKNGTSVEDEIIQLLNKGLPVAWREVNAKKLRSTFKVVSGGRKND